MSRPITSWANEMLLITTAPLPFFFSTGSVFSVISSYLTDTLEVSFSSFTGSFSQAENRAKVRVRVNIMFDFIIISFFKY
jgi:hypothetical protein